MNISKRLSVVKTCPTKRRGKSSSSGLDQIVSRLQGVSLNEPIVASVSDAEFEEAVKTKDIKWFLQVLVDKKSTIKPSLGMFYTLGADGDGTLYTLLRNSVIFEDYFSNNEYCETLFRGISYNDNYMLLEHLVRTHQLTHSSMDILQKYGNILLEQRAYKSLDCFFTFVSCISPLSVEQKQALKKDMLNKAMDSMDTRQITIVLNAIKFLSKPPLCIEWKRMDEST